MADDQDVPAPTTGTRDSALRPAASDLHPADPHDDLTGAPRDDGPPVDEAQWPADDAADGDSLGADLPDADPPEPHVPGSGVSDPGFADPDVPLPDATQPGDGTVGTPAPTEQPDALRTAEHGRESARAAQITSDSAPMPTERPAD